MIDDGLERGLGRRGRGRGSRSLTVRSSELFEGGAKAISSAYASKVNGGREIKFPLMIGGVPKGFEKLLVERKVREKALKEKWVWEIEREETGIDEMESGISRKRASDGCR